MPMAHSRGRVSRVGSPGDSTNELSSLGCIQGRSRGPGGGPLGTSSGSGSPSPPASSGDMARSVPTASVRSSSPFAGDRAGRGEVARRSRALLHYHGAVQPPTTGDWIAVTEEPLAIDAATTWATTPGSGAVVVFLGVVRDNSDGRDG